MLFEAAEEREVVAEGLEVLKLSEESLEGVAEVKMVAEEEGGGGSRRRVRVWVAFILIWKKWGLFIYLF